MPKCSIFVCCFLPNAQGETEILQEEESRIERGQRNNLVSKRNRILDTPKPLEKNSNPSKRPQREAQRRGVSKHLRYWGRRSKRQCWQHVTWEVTPAPDSTN